MLSVFKIKRKTLSDLRIRDLPQNENTKRKRRKMMKEQILLLKIPDSAKKINENLLIYIIILS
jgi:hypothetical protein